MLEIATHTRKTQYAMNTRRSVRKHAKNILIMQKVLQKHVKAEIVADRY